MEYDNIGLQVVLVCGLIYFLILKDDVE